MMRRGSLTEAQLRQELGLEEAAPEAPRRGSATIAWWQVGAGAAAHKLGHATGLDPASP